MRPYYSTIFRATLVIGGFCMIGCDDLMHKDEGMKDNAKTGMNSDMYNGQGSGSMSGGGGLNGMGPVHGNASDGTMGGTGPKNNGNTNGSGALNGSGSSDSLK